MLHRLMKVMLALALTVATAQAQEGNGPIDLPDPVKVKLDAYSGCWHGRQGDFRFTVKVGNDGYLFIELREPEATADGTPMGGRVPFLAQVNDYGSQLGNLPLERYGRDSVITRVRKGSAYELGWGDRASWGGKVLVTICFNTNASGF